LTTTLQRNQPALSAAVSASDIIVRPVRLNRFEPGLQRGPAGAVTPIPCMTVGADAWSGFNTLWTIVPSRGIVRKPQDDACTVPGP
jgi:hypothetical protein